MDYVVALIVYICSILGVFVSMGGMIAFKDSKAMVRFSTVSCFAFIFTMALGISMLNAIS
jgi:choline-glycine betaine transporter